MTGKILVIILALCAALAGAGMYYLQVYGFYYSVDSNPGQDVMLTDVATLRPVPVDYDGFQAIDADSSPIRFRACFTTGLRPEELSGRFLSAESAEPLTAPGWFDCYDAVALARALASGQARAFIGQKNVHYGVDRIVAIDDAGKGYVWHALNNCGQKAYDGTVVGEECPPRPQD